MSGFDSRGRHSRCFLKIHRKTFQPVGPSFWGLVCTRPEIGGKMGPLYLPPMCRLSPVQPFNVDQISERGPARRELLPMSSHRLPLRSCHWLAPIFGIFRISFRWVSLFEFTPILIECTCLVSLLLVPFATKIYYTWNNKGTFNSWNVFQDISKYLCESTDVDAISFTGSTAVGKVGR